MLDGDWVFHKFRLCLFPNDQLSSILSLCFCRSVTQQSRATHWSRDGPGTGQTVRAHIFSFYLTSCLLLSAVPVSSVLVPLRTESLRSQWVLAATAVAVQWEGWRSYKEKPPPGGTSTTGGRWRWKVTAPRKRQTPQRTDHTCDCIQQLFVC